MFPNYKKSSLIQKGLLTQKLFMNSKTMRAFQKMFVWTKQMFMNSKTTHAFQKMFVLTKQMLMHLKTAQNFKTNVCRLEKMFVDSKVFHVLDLGSFWKVLLCLGARSSFSHTRPPSHIRVHGRPVGRDAPIFFISDFVFLL